MIKTKAGGSLMTPETFKKIANVFRLVAKNLVWGGLFLLSVAVLFFGDDPDVSRVIAKMCLLFMVGLIFLAEYTSPERFVIVEIFCWLTMLFAVLMSADTTLILLPMAVLIIGLIFFAGYFGRKLLPGEYPPRSSGLD